MKQDSEHNDYQTLYNILKSVNLSGKTKIDTMNIL